MENGTMKNTYPIKIQNFEGPLDLLYHLIEKNKMSIYDIRIDEITDQYMEHLNAMQKMDLDVASEFLVMAATLLHIKSRMLLPDNKQKNEASEEIDPKEELLMRILQYKKYKEFSVILKEREQYWGRTLFKGPESIDFVFEEEPIDLEAIKLKEIFLRLIHTKKRKINEHSKQNMVKIIQYEKVSLRSKIREVIKSLINRTSVLFSELFLGKNKSKLEIVTGFLAILELAKMKKVELVQKETFGEIQIKRRDVSEELLLDDSFFEEQNIS